jgi:hypothetical protein
MKIDTVTISCRDSFLNRTSVRLSKSSSGSGATSVGRFIVIQCEHTGDIVESRWDMHMRTTVPTIHACDDVPFSICVANA